jgi:hypothetical protein
MRDFRGLAYASLPDVDDPLFQPRVRGMFADLDYFLRDLSMGVSRIQKGEVPDGSGAPLVGDNGALTDYFFLPGRPGDQIGYGGSHSGGLLTLGSTSDATKGSIRFGAVGAFDEANVRLGIGTLTPSAKLEVHQTGTNVNFAPTSTVSGTPQWRGSDGGSSLQTYVDESTPDDSDFISDGTNLGVTVRLGLPNITPQANTATITISFRIGWTGTNGGTAGVNTLTLKLRDGAGTTIHTDNSLNGYVTSGVHGNVAYQTVAFTLSSGEITSIANWNGMSLQIESGGGGTGYAGSVTCSWMQFSIVGGTAIDLVDMYDLSDVLRFKVTKDGYVTTPQLLLSGSVSGTLTQLPAATTTSYSVTWPSAQGAANTVLSNNGSGALSWVLLGSLPADFADNVFTLHDDVTPSKKLAFQLSGLSASTTRTLTPPDASGTLTLNDFASTFTSVKTFDADNGGAPVISGVDDSTTTLFTIHGTNSGFDATFTMSSLSANRVLAIPDGAGQLVTQTSTVSMSNKTLAATTLINMGASGVLTGAGAKLTRAASTTIYAQLDLSALSGTRVVALPDVTSQVSMVGDAADPPASANQIGKVNRTAQAAAIAATNLTNATPAGYYRVGYYLEDTIGDVTAGTVQLTVAWTDDIGATTATSAVVTLTGAGTIRDSNSIEVYLASGNITYSVAATGIFGTAKYALRMRVEFLG